MVEAFPISLSSISIDQVEFAGSHGMVKRGTVVGRVTSTGRIVPSPAAETLGMEGAEVACGVALDDVDASGGDMVGRITARIAEWRSDYLIYHSSVSDSGQRAAKHDQLAKLHVIVRDNPTIWRGVHPA